MRACGHCNRPVDERYRYCPWCASPQRSKLVEFFVGTGEDAAKALRVSHYTVERHVRFSVWDASGTAEAALSLDEDEARRVAAFLAPRVPPPTLLDRLRAAAGER